MGCQKIKVVRSLRYSGLTNTSCVCQVAVLSKRFNNKPKNSYNYKKTGDSIRFYRNLFRVADRKTLKNRLCFPGEERS